MLLQREVLCSLPKSIFQEKQGKRNKERCNLHRHSFNWAQPASHLASNRSSFLLFSLFHPVPPLSIRIVSCTVSPLLTLFLSVSFSLMLGFCERQLSLDNNKNLGVPIWPQDACCTHPTKRRHRAVEQRVAACDCVSFTR